MSKEHRRKAKLSLNLNRGDPALRWGPGTPTSALGRNSKFLRHTHSLKGLDKAAGVETTQRQPKRRVPLQPNNENSPQSCSAQYKYFSNLFAEIIHGEVKHKAQLQQIKNFFDTYVSQLEQGAFVKQVDRLSKENFALSKKLEHLQKSESAASTQRSYKGFAVPRLRLQGPAAVGFHQEFLDQVDEFSASWREALREGR